MLLFCFKKISYDIVTFILNHIIDIDIMIFSFEVPINYIFLVSIKLTNLI